MWFFSATINSWKHLLEPDSLKEVIINSLKWHHENKRAAIHGFVIMPNHIHLVWSAHEPFQHWQNETSLLRNTAHDFKKHLTISNPELLTHYTSTQADREYHFWERRSRSIEIMNRDIAWQKLGYIHHNPIQGKWRLAEFPEDYLYSSVAFYARNDTTYSFLRHYMDYI